jgi:RNA polymerase sigma-70 factor (ECF subfamily)
LATNPLSSTNKRNSPSNQLPAELDETLLMEKVAAGDQTALLLVYDRYSSLVYTLSVHVLRNPQSAEDATQEVFLRLWRKSTVYDPARGSLVSWLTVMARHHAIDSLRRQQREAQISDAVIPINCGHSDVPAYSCDDATVRSILEKLPPEQREVLTLAYFAGFTHTEIARHTGKPLGTVKSQIRLALQGLRRVLHVCGNERQTKQRVG